MCSGGRFWKPYIGQTVGGELASGPLFRSANQHLQIQLTTYCLPCKGFQKRPTTTFTLKMENSIFTEKLDHSQHSTRWSPKAEVTHYY
jgi:hypothetical protein